VSSRRTQRPVDAETRRDVLALYRAVVNRDPDGARAVHANTRSQYDLTVASVEFALRIASGGPGDYTGARGCSPQYAAEVLAYLDRWQAADPDLGGAL